MKPQSSHPLISRFLLAVCVAASCVAAAHSADLRLGLHMGPGSNNAFVPYNSESNGIYALQVAPALPGNFQTVRLANGTIGTRTFQYSNGPSPNAFFRIERQPFPLALDHLDRDGDGIDDLYEITHPPLDPFNPDDAGPYLSQYWSTIPLYAYFLTSSSSASASAAVINLPFYLTKPYTGTLRYQVSGTSVSGSDFQALSGLVAVNGRTGVIPITPISSPQIRSARSVVVTLQMETNKWPYTLSKPASHRLDLIEGDNGVYSGTMGFTNGLFFGAQPLVIAVRSTGGNTGTAYFDTSGSTFFTQPFSIPVTFTGPAGQFQFTAPATGNMYSTNLDRTLNWTLAIPTSAFTNNLLMAPFTLNVQGITSGSSALLAKGNIIVGVIGK